MKHSIVFLVLLLVFNCNSDKSGGFKIQINSSSSSIYIGDDISLNITSSTASKKNLSCETTITVFFQTH